jgi:hypothetical protein
VHHAATRISCGGLHWRTGIRRGVERWKEIVVDSEVEVERN